MAILSRMVKLCKADIHGVMDQLENRTLLLKQHLREMDASLGKKEAGLKNLMLLRDQVQREYERCRQETRELEKDLEIAIEKNRDDIARMLIRKMKGSALIQKQRQGQIESIKMEIDGGERAFAEQRLQYEELQQKANAYFQKAEQDAWDDSMQRVMPDRVATTVSEEEVELELLKRKEMIKGGEGS